MEKVVITSRLKLTLLESCDEDSEDLRLFHAVRMDEEATKWNMYGPQKTLPEAQKFLRTLLPNGDSENARYQVIYAVHRLLDGNARSQDPSKDSEVIGLCTLKPNMTVPIHDHMTTKTNKETGVLRLEIGYQFLPEFWGRGYATEACIALLEACRMSRPHFAPFTSLYIDGVVSPDHPASMKVLEKAGLKQIGLNKWEGEPVFLAGGMRDPVVWIYGITVF